MYLFDRESPDQHFGFYELTPGRRVRKLFDSPRPIDAVAQAGERLLVASGGAVLEATPGQPMKIVVSAPGLRSVAADQASGRIYFSDGASVFSVTDGCIGVVTHELGGAVKVRDGALLVLDPTKRTLVRFVGLP